MLFCLRGFRIAMLAQDGFSKLLALGLTFGFALQTFIIVGGVLRVIPLTGITLPFVSYGGSSIVANFILLAGLLLVSNRANATHGEPVMNKQITPRGRRRADPARLADGGDDVLAGLRRARARRQAGQLDPARRPVRRQARRDLRRRRAHGPGREQGRRRSRVRPCTSAATPQRGLAAHIVGYSTQVRSRAGLERSENDFLTGSNANLNTVVETTLDKLRGATVEGNDLYTTIRPGAQRVALNALGGRCGAAVALEPSTGKVLVASPARPTTRT